MRFIDHWNRLTIGEQTLLSGQVFLGLEGGFLHGRVQLMGMTGKQLIPAVVWMGSIASGELSQARWNPIECVTSVYSTQSPFCWHKV